MIVLGMSNDPGSGHYEDRVGLTPGLDGTYTVIDPLPDIGRARMPGSSL